MLPTVYMVEQPLCKQLGLCPFVFMLELLILGESDHGVKTYPKADVWRTFLNCSGLDLNVAGPPR